MSSNRATQPALGEPNKTAEAFETQKDLHELPKQIAEVAATLPGVGGVRLWQTINGHPTVWQESGKLPQADKITIEKVSMGHATAEADRSRQAWPLRSNGQVIGVLEVCGAGPLSANAQCSMEMFARISEAALDRAGQQQTIKELSVILGATKLLNSTLKLSEVINIILQLATQLSGADRGTVFLSDRERNEIWSLVGLGLQEREIRFPIERGIAGWVASHGEPVNVEDAYADPRFDPTVDRDIGYHTCALLALPVRNKDHEIVAVLELLNKKGGSFSVADQATLNYLSDHVALALENARLHLEMLAKQRMESDLLLAHSVQRGLLPEHPPEIEGFEISVAYTTSLMVGGDYYDFVPLGPRTLMIVIADVEGKGVASALMMANLQATLHALAAHVHTPEKITKSVNDMLLSDTRTEKLLSMFVCALDHRRRILHYVNAGHVPPVLLRADGRVMELSEGGMLLRVSSSAAYAGGDVHLRKDDIVAAYTDGITEAMDIHGNQFGLERLVNAVRRERLAPAQQIVEAVLAEVDRFSRGGPHDDDRVILILKVL